MASALVLLIGLVCWVFALPAQAQVSDDDDYPAVGDDAPPPSMVEPQQAPPTGGSTGLDEKNIRIGLMDVRAIFEVEQVVPKSVRDQIGIRLQQISEEINFAPRTIIPHESVMKYLGPREKKLYEKCWIDPVCLSVALKPANLDVAVVAKMRMKEIDPSQIEVEGKTLQVDPNAVLKEGEKKQVFAEYTIFLRIADLAGRKKLREVLITHTDYRLLPEMAARAYREMLLELNFITDQPVGMVPAASPIVADESYSPTVQEEMADEPVRNLGLKVAAYTTLGAGILAEGLALTFYLLAENAKADYNDNATSPGQMASLADDHRTYRLTGHAMAATGAGLLISSAVLFVYAYDDDRFAGSGGGAIADVDKGITLENGGVSASPDGFYLQAEARF